MVVYLSDEFVRISVCATCGRPRERTVCPYYVVSIKILHIHNIFYETQKALAIHNSRCSGRLPCVKEDVSEAD